MSAVFYLAMKVLLWRNKAGLFFVIVFPLLMALFFGSIFSSGGSGKTEEAVGGGGWAMMLVFAMTGGHGAIDDDAQVHGDDQPHLSCQMEYLSC